MAGLCGMFLIELTWGYMLLANMNWLYSVVEKFDHGETLCDCEKSQVFRMPHMGRRRYGMVVSYYSNRSYL